MAKQKTKFDIGCFGTFDEDNKDKSCNNCAYSEECEEFKPNLKDKLATATEKGKTDYLEEKAEATSTAISKLLGYGLAIVILLFVFWNISKEV